MRTRCNGVHPLRVVKERSAKVSILLGRPGELLLLIKHNKLSSEQTERSLPTFKRPETEEKKKVRRHKQKNERMRKRRDSAQLTGRGLEQRRCRGETELTAGSEWPHCVYERTFQPPPNQHTHTHEACNCGGEEVTLTAVCVVWADTGIFSLLTFS